MSDLEVREMARQSLENHQSGAATDALIAALDSAGPEFCCGVISSLAKRRGPKVAAALGRAAEDPHEDVRIAALYALAGLADPQHDAPFEKAAKSRLAGERRAAHVARTRLAATLRVSGNRAAGERVYKAILASDAPEPQKKACRLALA